MLAFFSVFLRAFVLIFSFSTTAPLVYLVARSDASTHRQSTIDRLGSLEALTSSHSVLSERESPKKDRSASISQTMTTLGMELTVSEFRMSTFLVFRNWAA